ncbi:wall-associated receptor kinase 2-like [Telopea speciosissima]|uniref:wall-associated receptor kinase 2-like n=1 Tax=Telopea speciosissima TaxID=54955 RepID=UPI001CC335F8|nr:wall-associated receptor kinase 2-like [Telopea speciosissima]
MGPFVVLQLLLLLLLWWWPVVATSVSLNFSVAMPGCQEKCGNITVPYPFGFGASNCYRPGYQLICNHSYNPGPKLFTFSQYQALQVFSVSIEGQLQTLSVLARDCYGISGENTFNFDPLNWLGGPFTYSDTENRFTVLGCDTVATISDWQNNWNFSSGCILACNSQNFVNNGTCSIGCCQTLIPKGYKYLYINITSYHNHTDIWSFNPCGSAFLVGKDWLNFSLSSLSDGFNVTIQELPVVLDWAIEWSDQNKTKNHSCLNEPSYACGNNSNCSESKNGLGYSCNCTKGYQGNPYLPVGCQGNPFPPLSFSLPYLYNFFF